MPPSTARPARTRVGGDGGSGYACASSSLGTGVCEAIRSCVSDADPCSGYYEANGQTFACGDVCDPSSLVACAQAVVDYCVATADGGGGSGWDGGDDDDDGGCTIASPHGRSYGATALLLLVMPGLAAMRRRRTPRAPP
jgi:hypothetical protein